MEWQIDHYETVSSTNDLALQQLRTGRGTAGQVLVAEVQTAGQGRPGRAWNSQRGALMLTAILPFYPLRVGWTALAAGIAVAEAVRELGVAAGVKWPNDVLVDGRKLAGILAEAAGTELVAVGIGLNVANPPPADPALARRTARLAEFLPSPTSAAVLPLLLARVGECWELLAAPDPAPLRRRWETLDTTAGRRVRWSAGAVTGIARGVDAAGRLRIEAAEGRLVLASAGEVEFLSSAAVTGRE